MKTFFLHQCKHPSAYPLVCSQCLSVSYCSEKCAQSDWMEQHSTQCTSLKARVYYPDEATGEWKSYEDKFGSPSISESEYYSSSEEENEKAGPLREEEEDYFPPTQQVPSDDDNSSFSKNQEEDYFPPTQQVPSDDDSMSISVKEEEEEEEEQTSPPPLLTKDRRRTTARKRLHFDNEEGAGKKGDDSFSKFMRKSKF